MEEDSVFNGIRSGLVEGKNPPPAQKEEVKFIRSQLKKKNMDKIKIIQHNVVNWGTYKYKVINTYKEIDPAIS